jgi:4-alpha-glucanotransferase
LLSAGSLARMNTPGKQGGNWSWRFQMHELSDDIKNRLSYLTWLYQRKPDQQNKEYGDVATKDKA